MVMVQLCIHLGLFFFFFVFPFAVEEKLSRIKTLGVCSNLARITQYYSFSLATFP